MRGRDKGMTILEVVFAIMILSIAVGFMLVSNKAYYQFRQDRQERQQMLFYAAGQMEAYLEGQTVAYNSPPFDQYTVDFSVSPVNEDLEIIRVEVKKGDSPQDPDPVSIFTYRVTP